MTDRGEDRDRMIDVLLGEVVGGERPPDLSERILSKARSDRAWMKGALPVAAAAAVFLGIAVLILTQEPGPGSTSVPAAPVEVLDAPLPEPLRNFNGRLVGRLVSATQTDVVIRVESVDPDPRTRAADPSLFIGRDVRAVLGGRNSEQRLSLQEAASRFHRDGDVVTVTLWTEREEALFLQDIRRGVHTGPDPK